MRYPAILYLLFWTNMITALNEGFIARSPDKIGMTKQSHENKIATPLGLAITM
jgi:hypothetical protein